MDGINMTKDDENGSDASEKKTNLKDALPQKENLYSSYRTEKKARKKHLSFRLGEELFTIPLAKVQEVLKLTTVTPVPNGPAYVRGFINLRGNIVTVVDLRMKMFDEKEFEDINRQTCIMICDVLNYPIGFVVDQVIEVYSYSKSDILEVDNSKNKKVDYITAVAKNEDDNLLVILDIDKVIDLKEIKLFSNAS